MTTKKKTTKKKTAKKAPPRNPSSGSDVLAKRVKALEDKVQALEDELEQLKEAMKNDADVEGEESESDDGFEEVIGIDVVALNGDFKELKELVLGPVTTKIRQTEKRVQSCEDRLEGHDEQLGDIEALLIEGGDGNDQASGT